MGHRFENGISQLLLNLRPSIYFGDIHISWNDSLFIVDAGKGDFPCVGVTWYGAAAYCNFLTEAQGNSLTTCYSFSIWGYNLSATGYRLLTEAEWEYAARGGKRGNETTYSGANDPSPGWRTVAWCSDNSGGASHAVGTKNANELGLHDMSGNVFEWCNDKYDANYYITLPENNPSGPYSGTQRVRRGRHQTIHLQSCGAGLPSTRTMLIVSQASVVYVEFLLATEPLPFEES